MSNAIETFSDGAHLAISNERYHKSAGLSHSMCKNMEPPARLAAYMTEEHESTGALLVGSLVHALVLQPDAPLPNVVIKPADMKYNSAANKAWRDAHLASGRQILTQSEADSVRYCSKAISEHETAARIFAEGLSEISLFETVQVKSAIASYKVQRKCRLDFLPLGNALVDIKTTTECGATEDAFSKTMSEWRYFTQASWYLGIWNSMLRKGMLNALPEQYRTPRESFVFIVVEKCAPYLVNAFYVDTDSLAYGKRQNNRDLLRFAQCANDGRWPGFDTSIKPIRINTWTQRDLDKLELSMWGSLASLWEIE